MAATMHKRALATGVAQKSAPVRSRVVRVSCSKQGESVLQKVQTVAAAFAAAALLQASPVSAKVVLEQPQLKKVFQDDGTPAAPAPKKEIILPGQRSKAAPSPAAAAAKPAAKPQVAETSGGDLDPRSVALPGALVVIAGGAVALSKLDDGWEDFMRTASVKDSGEDGAGYETAIKGGNGVAAKKGGSRPGTRKVKAASKTSSGSGSPLASLFGKE